MEQTASTANTREFTAIDFSKPCRRCGGLSGREYSDRYECVECGLVLPKKQSDSVQTTFTHDGSETTSATQAEVEAAVREVEDDFLL